MPDAAIIILANEKICRIHPPGPPCFWRAGQGAAAKIVAPFPAAAEKGSPEGQVPLALSAQDRPPRRRTERQTLTRTSIIYKSTHAVEAPCTGRYARWCGRPAGQRFARLLPGLSFFNKLRPAFGTGNIDFSLSPWHTQCHAAVGTGKITVCFPVMKALFHTAKPFSHRL